MKRGTLANALKLFFGLYAVYVALINVQTAIRLPTMRYYIWAGFGLCLLPVAWGLVRERKWAWNAAAGLLIVQLIWGAGQLLGMYVVGGMTGRTSGVFPVTLQGSLLGLEKSLALIALLIVARRSYQTGFAAVPAGSETKRNSYVRPVALGALFLMIGGLMLLHPIAGQYSPTPLRVVGLALCGLLSDGRPVACTLCHADRCGWAGGLDDITQLFRSVGVVRQRNPTGAEYHSRSHRCPDLRRICRLRSRFCVLRVINGFWGRRVMGHVEPGKSGRGHCSRRGP
jgi:hypothetical protein